MESTRFMVPKMLVEKTFDTGEVEINYAEGPPSGPPLVLLHGLTERWQRFLPIMPALSMRCHIYAPDFRGHGRSGRVSGRYLLGDYAADTTVFLGEKLTEPAILFGHSLGGVVAIMIAARRPEMVRAVVVGDSPLPIAGLHEQLKDYRSFWAGWRDLVESGLSVKELVTALTDMPLSIPGQDEVVRYGDTVDAVSLLFVAKCLSLLDPDTLTPFVEMCDGHDRVLALFEGYEDEALLAISCPVLLLQGNVALGGLMTDRQVENALSMLPDASYVVIEHAGHDLGLGTWNVAPLLQALSNFIESL